MIRQNSHKTKKESTSLDKIELSKSIPLAAVASFKFITGLSFDGSDLTSLVCRWRIENIFENSHKSWFSSNTGLSDIEAQVRNAVDSGMANKK